MLADEKREHPGHLKIRSSIGLQRGIFGFRGRFSGLLSGIVLPGFSGIVRDYVAGLQLFAFSAWPGRGWIMLMRFGNHTSDFSAVKSDSGPIQSEFNGSVVDSDLPHRRLPFR